MNGCPDFDHLLLIPRLQVQSANAISSPLTHGFPSITAFLGLMWALERRTRAAGIDLAFNAVGVVCHSHEEQVTKGGFVQSFRLTRNPIGKDGVTSAIVEEGRIHLNLSLIFAVHSRRWLNMPATHEVDVEQVTELLAGMRVAGGTIIPSSQPNGYRHRPCALPFTGNEYDQHAIFRSLRMQLLPGFALVGRDDLLDTRLADLRVDNPNASVFDAWLSLSRINWRYREAPTNSTIDKRERWQNDRKDLGWVVPIPVGYGALGGLQPAGSVVNSRDTTTEFRFVESLYSVGQWLSPHRLRSARQLLWYADSQPDTGHYRCRNDYRPTAQYDFD